ncbi:MAG: cell division protein ZapA [Pseudomonadota bacterium]
MSKADIEIHGKRYSIACAPGQEERLVQFGQRLDTRVRHIAQAVGDIGETRLLLIAALALMDENEALKAEPQQGRIEGRAAAALVDAAARIDALASRLDAANPGDEPNA